MLTVDRSNYAPRNPYTDAPQPIGHQVGLASLGFDLKGSNDEQQENGPA